MALYDLIIRAADLVRPESDEPRQADIAVSDGVVVAVGGQLDPADADETVDGTGLLAFPGAVDVHQHWGIYNDLAEDADSESRASAQGGVTSGITYMRTGQYYLNRSGPYAEVFPEVLARSAGRAYIDYGFHLAPMMNEHIAEIPELIDRFGVSSFKIFMFYGSHGLHGRSDDQSAFLMTPPDEKYDIAHFEFVMRGIQAARAARPDLAGVISLSLHCETPEIMTAYTKLVEESGALSGLEAYSASRPPHSEGLAVTIASYLAYETELPTINLLHLSSAKAMDAAMKMAVTFPNIDFRREVTIGHLVTDYERAGRLGVGGKVNPPLRARSDVDALWEHVLAGDVSWITSDHACCKDERKFGADRSDVFAGSSGFGGTEYLLPALVSEGRRRGLSYGAMARLVSTTPAARFGLGARKGRIEVGFDADIALVDPSASWTVHSTDSFSAQEYTPFEGLEMTAKVVQTFLRGKRIFADGKIIGEPTGTYLSRPL
ncbi:MAG TPA: dihydroorotase family protein [Pseudonocardiaceae bacterium]|nr:dihydroorotase family protein [Pseudonocardiaceae bacterium]